MTPPSLIRRHIGERVRIHLSPRGSIVAEVLDADETAIALRLGDGSTATVPITSILSIRSKAGWARASA